MSRPIAENPINAAYARARLSYDPATGIVVWKVGNCNSIIPGKIAGYQSSDGSWNVCIRKSKYKLHRIIWLLMTGGWPSETIDHIDCNKSSNKWCNLRLATRHQQQMNRAVRQDSESGVKGVSERPLGSGRWHARIKKNGVEHHLGVFRSKEAAHTAYVNKARELQGDFMAPVSKMMRGERHV